MHPASATALPTAPLNPWAALSVSSLTTGCLGYLFLSNLAGWEGTSKSSNFAFGAVMPIVGTATGFLTEKTAMAIFQRFNQHPELTDNQIRANELLKRLSQLGTLSLTALACETLGFEGSCPASTPLNMLGNALWYAPAAIPVAGALTLAAGTFDEKAPSLECALVKPLAILSSLFLTLPAISNLMHHMWDASYATGSEMITWQASTAAYGVGSAFLIGSILHGALAMANQEIEQRRLQNLQAVPITPAEQALVAIKTLAVNEPKTFAKIVEETKDPVVKAELQAIAQLVAFEKLSTAVVALVQASAPSDKTEELVKEIKDIATGYPELFAAVLAETKDPRMAACLQKIAAELVKEKEHAATTAPAV